MPKLRDKGSGYSMRFENAMRNFCGKKYYGYAGGAINAKTVKEALLEAIKKIRTSLRNATTMDERVALTTGLVLDELAREIQKIGKKNCYEWEMIFTLFELVSYLVGYDWQDGETHRQLIYYQTEEQKAEDERKRDPIKDIEAYANFEYMNSVLALRCLYRHEKKSIKEIALIAGVSESWIRRRLRRYRIINE